MRPMSVKKWLAPPRPLTHTRIETKKNVAIARIHCERYLVMSGDKGVSFFAQASPKRDVSQSSENREAKGQKEEKDEGN